MLNGDSMGGGLATAIHPSREVLMYHVTATQAIRDQPPAIGRGQPDSPAEYPVRRWPDAPGAQDHGQNRGLSRPREHPGHLPDEFRRGVMIDLILQGL